MVSKKRKLLKLGILCLMPLLALLITISNTYAYSLDANGNLVSNNLSNIDNSVYTTSSYSSTNITKIYVGQGNAVSFSLSYNDTRSNSGNGGLGFWYGDADFNVSGSGWNVIFNNQRIILNENVGSQTITLNNYVMPQDYLYIICGATFNTGTFNINQCMVNLGSQLLPYEPFGIWYNSEQFEISNYGPLYKVLNGTTAKLYDFNSSELSDMLQATPIINETIVWNNNYDFKNSMIPNIRNAIINGSDALYNVERPMVLLSLKTPLLIDNLSFYRMVRNEIRYVYLYFDDGSMESVSISNASDVSTKFSIWYNESKKSLTYIAFDNEVNFDMVSTITQPGYSMVYSDAYNNGSIDGYKEGYNMGLKQSNPISYNEGYNKGYNDGIQEDLESSGFRTLITTILSYPVNMVRQSLNFEFMGVHVASIVLFIISLGIVAFVIKRFKD